jgi:hypothetical protein
LVPSIISKERAEPIIAPYRDLISGCLWRAWDTWKITALPVAVAARSRANVVYDYAADEARRTLKDVPGLTLTESRGFVLVNIEDKLILRYKKFRNNLRTSGIPTQQALDFAHQQLSIPGMPPVTHLVAGYLLDDFAQEISRVAITCSIGSRIVWVLDLPRPDAGVVEALDTPRMEPPDATVRSTRTRESREQES